MAGYRENSFDPSANVASANRPMRPFNWVQWIGVACDVAALAVLAVYAAGRIGWIPQLLKTATPVVGLMLIGMLLINSRQEPIPDLAPELAPARKRWLIILTAAAVLVLGVATVLTLLGD